MSNALQFSALSDKIAAIGESPIWSQAEQALYWIDCNAPALHRLVLDTGEERCWEMPCRIGGVVPSANGPVVILRTGVFALDQSDGTLEQLAPSPLTKDNLVLHEARCDAAGRLWVGTINLDYIHEGGRGGAELFRLSGGRLLPCEAASGGTVSNGLAWSPDASIMYYADTAERTIWAFDFDVASGSASNRRLFHQLPIGMGVPDGAAVDVEGGYWFACPGAGRIRRLNPDGSLDRETPTPCDWPTKVAFGSAAMDRLIISSLSMRGATPGKEAFEGRLFSAPAPIPGTPEPLFDPAH